MAEGTNPARVGLILPSSNTTMEADLQQALAGRATVHTARMLLSDPVTRDGELRMLDEFAPPAARDLGTIDPDLVVFGCTSAGALRGAEADHQLREELAEACGVPVMGVLDSITKALRRLGAKRVSLLTPYEEPLTEAVAASLVADGFEVSAKHGLGCSENLAIGRVPPEEIAAAAAEVTDPDSEALVIACTNFRAYEVRDQIADETGKPVVTALSVVIDEVLEQLPKPT